MNSKLFVAVLLVVSGVMLVCIGEYEDAAHDQPNATSTVDRNSHEDSFSAFGVAVVLFSCCLSGLRWALTQRIFHGPIKGRVAYARIEENGEFEEGIALQDVTIADESKEATLSAPSATPSQPNAAADTETIQPLELLFFMCLPFLLLLLFRFSLPLSFQSGRRTQLV